MVLRVVTFKIQEDELDFIDSVALKLGLSRSELIRRAVFYYIKVKANNNGPRPRIVRLD